MYNQLFGIRMRFVSLWVALVFLIQNHLGHATAHTGGHCAKVLWTKNRLRVLD
jgi:hypothetical protein